MTVLMTMVRGFDGLRKLKKKENRYIHKVLCFGKRAKEMRVSISSCAFHHLMGTAVILQVP